MWVFWGTFLTSLILLYNRTVEICSTRWCQRSTRVTVICHLRPDCPATEQFFLRTTKLTPQYQERSEAKGPFSLQYTNSCIVLTSWRRQPLSVWKCALKLVCLINLLSNSLWVNASNSSDLQDFLFKFEIVFSTLKQIIPRNYLPWWDMSPLKTKIYVVEEEVARRKTRHVTNNLWKLRKPQIYL